MSREPRRPDRPEVPPTLHALVATLVAERVCLSSSLAMEPPVAVGISVMACVGAWLALRSRLAQVARSVVLVALCAALAVASCGVRGRLSADAVARLGSSAVSTWSFEVVADASKTVTGWRSRARARDGEGHACDVWLQGKDAIARGSVVSGVGRFSANGDDEWGEANRRAGVAGSVRMVRVTSIRPPGEPLRSLEALRDAVVRRLSPAESDGGAVLAGSVCGEREHMRDRGLTDVFATCGVAHLVAVSGSHLAILTSLLSVALARTRLGPRARLLVLLAAGGLFVLFCGAPLSAVRAWAMSTVAFGSLLAGRRAHALSSVCVVALCMALLDPGVSGSVAFELSVASVVGLCLFSSYGAYVLEALLAPRHLPHGLARVAARVRPRSQALRQALAATMVCQAATLPVTCATFGQLSLVAPVANALVAPAFALMMGVGMVGAALFWTPVAGPILWVAERVGDGCALALSQIARLPLASVRLKVDEGPALAALLGVSALLLVTWPRVRRRPMALGLGVCALVLVGWLARWRLFAPARVCVLDVGQGDAILVQDGASAVLVDAGPDGAVADALARQNVFHLDAVIVTHLHDDHYGGLDDLAGRVGCERVMVARGVGGNLGGEPGECVRALVGGEVEEVGLGDVVRVGGFALRCVWPEGEVAGDENAHSLEFALEYDGGGRSLSGLLTGDAERDETGRAIETGRVGDVDFLKVGHHGSRVSLTPGEARALDAEVSVASAGENNRFGHPTPECVEMLESSGSTFLCTKDVGTVTIEPAAEGPRVSCERGGALAPDVS